MSPRLFVHRKFKSCNVCVCYVYISVCVHSSSINILSNTYDLGEIFQSLAYSYCLSLLNNQLLSATKALLQTLLYKLVVANSNKSQPLAKETKNTKQNKKNPENKTKQKSLKVLCIKM